MHALRDCSRGSLRCLKIWIRQLLSHIPLACEVFRSHTFMSTWRHRLIISSWFNLIYQPFGLLIPIRAATLLIYRLITACKDFHWLSPYWGYLKNCKLVAPIISITRFIELHVIFRWCLYEKRDRILPTRCAAMLSERDNVEYYSNLFLQYGSMLSARLAEK